MRSAPILRRKLAIPVLDADARPRPRLNKLLERVASFPVSVVQAGAGYGKTTAVVHGLTSLRVPCCWYSPGPEDASSFVFACHLAAALDPLLPGLKQRYAEALEDQDVFSWEKALDFLLCCLGDREGGTAVLVVDDWHAVGREQGVACFFDRFLAGKPGWLKVVILSREKVALPEVCRLGARGERLLVEDRNLTFTVQEAFDYLVQVVNRRVTREDVLRIHEYTEGWAIALKLVGKKLAENSFFSTDIPEGADLNALFDFLALEVLERQEPELQSFLLKSSLLEYVHAPACAAVMGEEFAPSLIQRTVEKRLFLSEVEEGLYRYHNLFRHFLRREARKRLPDWEALHCRAGYFYLREGREEEALPHLLKARQWADAAEVLSRLSTSLVYSGRVQFLRHCLEPLPADLRSRPEFLVALGDAQRLACNYESALALYREAEKKCAALGDRRGLARALRGIGEVYIDTIEPVLAGKFLRRAYQLLGEESTEERAELLYLLAENALNQGKARQAKRYQQVAGEMFHLSGRGNLKARLLLRTGRLEAAIRLLEGRLRGEREGYRPPVSFRETPLLLSLCYSFVGEAEKAVLAAEEGIRLGAKLKSPFVEAVGYVRKGHALLVRDGWPTAGVRESYQTALELNDRLGVIRGRTEVLMGQCLMYGLLQDWRAAQRCGLEGIAVTERVRDRWFSAVLYHCLGAAAVNCRQYAEAAGFLKKAREMFSRCGDSFGKAAATWWLASLALKTDREEEFIREAAQLLELCEGKGYDFLLQRATLLGSQDGRASLPLLREASMRNINRAYVDWLLKKLGVTHHLSCAAYTLRVQTLGRFRVWRGEEEIKPTEWRRESARRLFLLFLTRRRQLLHKDEIMAYMWPDAEPEAALRDFKVALNALLNVLEPGREPRSPSLFIQRSGAAYHFNLASGYWLDAEEFENLVLRAQKVAAEWPEQAEIQLRRAVELYEGEYLQGVCQDEWCLEERERLAVLHIRALELLAQLLALRGEYAGCLTVANKILEKDNCWEEAYRLQMVCYAKLNNQAMVTRVYQRCATVLREELGVAPSAETTGLYNKLAQELQAV